MIVKHGPSLSMTVQWEDTRADSIQNITHYTWHNMTMPTHDQNLYGDSFITRKLSSGILMKIDAV